MYCDTVNWARISKEKNHCRGINSEGIRSEVVQIVPIIMKCIPNVHTRTHTNTRTFLSVSVFLCIQNDGQC